MLLPAIYRNSSQQFGRRNTRPDSVSQTVRWQTVADWAHIPFNVLATISNRLINEVAGVNRVVYDISSKPPATIEWE